ncbi:DNA-binding protein [Halosimplex pelagicum]|uniref:DNA-binding protein n=1 Tax=Halosimplex pelagicum TaxID=869886 RepID=A0A7D5TJD5_9EURY|nr:DNA-binding protein [Halosimplex pelagicum]QLH84796.1 DNA-binding protein [Halosimplex pelagicum]
MNSSTRFGSKVSDAQADEQEVEAPVEEQPELRRSVDQEIQGKVDTNHPEARPEGMTLEGEEKFRAREAEIRSTRQRLDRRQSSDREARTREVVNSQTRYAQEERPDDPRTKLSKEQLAEVNKRAAQIADELDERSRAGAAYRLAKKVAEGVDMLNATLLVKEELHAAPGVPVPIETLEEVPRSTVDIEGEVVQLWDSDNPRIQQVGLIEDDSGRTKFTVWEKSRKPWVDEGQTVRLREVEKSWYEGRVSVAVTGWSQVEFPERGRWWDE